MSVNFIVSKVLEIETKIASIYVNRNSDDLIVQTLRTALMPMT